MPRFGENLESSQSSEFADRIAELRGYIEELNEKRAAAVSDDKFEKDNGYPESSAVKIAEIDGLIKEAEQSLRDLE